MRTRTPRGLCSTPAALVFCACGSDDSANSGVKDAGADSGSGGGFTGGSGGSSGSTTGGSGGSGGATGGAGGATGGTDAGVDAGGASGAAGADAGATGGTGGTAGADAGATGGTGGTAGADAGATGGIGGVDAGAAGVSSDFDESPGANTYLGGLKSSNWVGASFHAPNAGTQLFASGNGNASGTFANLGIKKDLGGQVANVTYNVSFYVVQPDSNQMGIELADFSRLRIGGPNGSMSWTATPVPTSPGNWVQWKGTYTPAAGDIGGPFFFDAQFDLDAKHSIGIDGPVVATPQ